MAGRATRTKIKDRVLIVPDCHRPYHSKAAWQVMLAAARQLKPTIIIILGDFVDCYSVTSHSKNPERADLALHDEVASACEGLNDLDGLGAKRKVYIEGNHEDRLKRLIADRAPALYGVTTMPELLSLKKRGWEWVPYRTHTRIGRLYLTHDVGHAGVNAVRQSQQAFNASVVIGHTHRMAYQITGNLAGKPHVAASFGWLGDEQAASEYMHKSKLARDWFHGFGVAYVEPGGNVHLRPIPIINKRCVVGGEIVAA